MAEKGRDKNDKKYAKDADKKIQKSDEKGKYVMMS
jgi:hypothetical protein